MHSDAQQPDSATSAATATTARTLCQGDCRNRQDDILDPTAILAENIALRSLVNDMAGDLRVLFGGHLPDDFAQRLSHLTLSAQAH